MSEIHNKIISYFKNLETPIILDIGSYRLEDSAVFSNLFPRARIYAFECDPVNLKAIFKVERPFNIKVETCAICDKNEEIDFYPSEKIDWTKNWNYSGSIRKPKEHLTEYTVSFGKPFKIQGKRLDTWYEENLIDKEIELLFIDVNGGEMDLINGGRETIKRSNLIYIEAFEKDYIDGQVHSDIIKKEIQDLGFDIFYSMDIIFCLKRYEQEI
jgi:FkbM family methyltransferase